MKMKISFRYLLTFLTTPLLYAEASVAPQHLPLYKALCSGDEETATAAMEEAQGNERFNNAFFELCDTAIAQGDVNLFAKLPAMYLNEECGYVDSPFDVLDGKPKPTYYFASPIVHAAAAGKTDIVRVLLQRGADAGATEAFSRTALVYAAANGHLPCVQLLYPADAEHAGLALWAAVHFKREAVADYLRAQGAALPSLSEAELAELTQRTPTGETELMRAVAEDDTERVAYILMYAPQLVNLQNSYGYTALMQAESAEMVNLLLAFGADISLKNDFGCTALDVACRAFRPVVVDALVAANAPIGCPSSALRYACAGGHVSLARRVLATGGVDVNTRAAGEESLLALAVKSQSEEMLQLLLSHGAKPEGSGALQAAVHTDQPHLVRLFMEYEHLCLPSERSPRQGFSAQDKLNALLHAACIYNAPKTVAMLLEMGADANDTRMTSYGRFATGNSPLHDAVRGSVEILKLLLAAGADINARNKKGDTPLILAAKFRYAEPYTPTTECAMLLLEHGADATLVNKEGKSVADYARDNSLLQALQRIGVEPRQASAFLSPLMQAYMKDDKKEFQRLLQAGADADELISGITLLQNLVREDGDAEYARMLIAAGADVQRCREVFGVAMGRAHIEMARALLAGGFTVQPRGEETREYLSRAFNGHEPQKMLPLLVQAGADINAEDARGLTLLMEMAMNENFIEHRFNVLLSLQPHLEITLQGSTAEWNGLTALGLAVKMRNMEAAYRLLQAGAKATPQQVQVIFFHVLREHPEQADVLLSRYGASPTAPEPVTGLSPMDIATRSGNEALMSLLKTASAGLFEISGMQVSDVQRATELIAAGADVNARDAEGNTPLMVASAHVARNGYADDVWRELLRVYVAAGVDLHARNNAGLNVAELCAYAWGPFNAGVAQELMARGVEMRPDYRLLYACRTGSDEAVKSALAAGANADVHHALPLKLSMEPGTLSRPNQDAVVLALLEGGADPNADAAAVLHVAVHSRHVTTLEALFAHGLDLSLCASADIADALGYLWLQEEEFPKLCFDVLIRNGADVNAYRQQPGKVVREPLLHLAVRYQGAAELTRLLELGADPSLTDEQGRTALDLARELNRCDLIPLLEAADN